MASKPIPDVTLACVDPALLQCWEEKVHLTSEAQKRENHYHADEYKYKNH